MLGEQLLVVADAHLGTGPPEPEERLMSFFEDAPGLGDCLLINGDLFDFWFTYRRVIPRTGFTVAAALGRLRERMPIVMVGGNHDRWGDAFWQQDLGVAFAPLETRLEIGDRKVLAVHGDGLHYERPSANLLHWLLKQRATVALWRAIHPDLGFWLADRLSGVLGHSASDPEAVERVVELQRQWARARLAAEPSLGAVIMGHIHRSLVAELEPGRFYLNPGAWFEEQRYGVVTAASVELRSYR